MGGADPICVDGFVLCETTMLRSVVKVLGGRGAAVVVLVVVEVDDQNETADVLLGRVSVLAVEPAVLLRSICTAWCKLFEWSWLSEASTT